MLYFKIKTESLDAIKLKRERKKERELLVLIILEELF